MTDYDYRLVLFGVILFFIIAMIGFGGGYIAGYMKGKRKKDGDKNEAD